MSGPEFGQPRMGQIFFESTMPSIARSLEVLAKHAVAGPADRGVRISMMASTIVAGLVTREGVLPFKEGVEVARHAVEVAFEIEKPVTSKLGGAK